MLTPYNVNKHFLAGISRYSHQAQGENGLSMLDNLEVHGKVLRALRQDGSVKKLRADRWLIGPQPVKTAGPPLYVGQGAIWPIPYIFIGAPEDEEMDEEFHQLPQLWVAPFSGMVHGSYALATETLILDGEGALRRVAIEDGEHIGNEGEYIEHYASQLLEHKQRPIIVRPGAGLMSSFDTFLNAWLTAVGADDYTLDGVTLSLTGLIPEQARERTVLFGGLFGAVVETILDPEGFLIGEEVSMTDMEPDVGQRFTMQLDNSNYVLYYSAPEDDTAVTISIYEQGNVTPLHTLSLIAGATTQVAYLPKMPKAATYSMYANDETAVLSVRANYIEDFLRRVDWGFITLPERTGQILHAAVLGDNIIVVCDCGVYALVPNERASYDVVRLIADDFHVAMKSWSQDTQDQQMLVVNWLRELYAISADLKARYVTTLKTDYVLENATIVSNSKRSVLTGVTGPCLYVGETLNTGPARYCKEYARQDGAYCVVRTFLMDFDTPGLKRLEKIDFTGFGQWEIKVWARTNTATARILVLDRLITTNDCVNLMAVGESFLVEMVAPYSDNNTVENLTLWWRIAGRTRDAARPGNQWYR